MSQAVPPPHPFPISSSSSSRFYQLALKYLAILLTSAGHVWTNRIAAAWLNYTKTGCRRFSTATTQLWCSIFQHWQSLAKARQKHIKEASYNGGREERGGYCRWRREIKGQFVVCLETQRNNLAPTLLTGNDRYNPVNTGSLVLLG